MKTKVKAGWFDIDKDTLKSKCIYKIIIFKKIWEWIWMNWVYKKKFKKLGKGKILNTLWDSKVIWSDIKWIESETKWQ